jgi:hypothetical protein
MRNARHRAGRKSGHGSAVPLRREAALRGRPLQRQLGTTEKSGPCENRKGRPAATLPAWLGTKVHLSGLRVNQDLAGFSAAMPGRHRFSRLA